MFLDSYINQKVQVQFKNLPESMSGSITGIYFPNKWCVAKLIATESLGIWLENPCYHHTKVREDDGTNIPESDQIEHKCPTNILIKWEYINSIITFPNEEMEGVGKGAKLIGFHS